MDRFRVMSFLFSVFVFLTLVFSIQMPPAAVDPLAELPDSAISRHLHLPSAYWGFGEIIDDGDFEYGNLSRDWSRTAGWTVNTAEAFVSRSWRSAQAAVQNDTVAVIGQTLANWTFSVLRNQTVELSCDMRGSAVEETSFDQAQLAIRFGHETEGLWTNVSEVVSPWVERPADFTNPWFSVSLEALVPDSTVQNITAMRVEVRAREMSGPIGYAYVDDVSMLVIDQVNVSVQGREVILRVSLGSRSHEGSHDLDVSLVASAQGDEYVDWVGIEARLLPYRTFAYRDITDQPGRVDLFSARVSYNQSEPTRDVLPTVDVATHHLAERVRQITRSVLGMVGGLLGGALSPGTAAGTAYLGDFFGEMVGATLANNVRDPTGSLASFDSSAGNYWGSSADSYTLLAVSPPADVQYVRLTHGMYWVLSPYVEQGYQYALLLKGCLLFRPSHEYVQLAVIVDANA